MDNISSLNGQKTIAYVGSTPWHGFGNRVPAAVATDIDGFLQAAGLDWTVSLEPIFDGSGSTIPLGQLVRRDVDARQLALVGPAYVELQNREVVSIFEDAIAEFGLSFAVAGALGRGEVCWALARLPGGDVDITGDGDNVNGYALLKWGHGDVAATGTATFVRVVCQNTLALAAQSDKSTFARIIHTASGSDRVKQARALFTGLTKTLVATGDSFKQLAERKLTTAEIIAYIESVFPGESGVVSDITKARRATVSQLVFDGVGVEKATARTGGDPNAWSVYNAVTEYFDHVRPAEARSASGVNKANVSAIFGGNAATKVKALELARELVAA